jgi:rhamnosyltransferase subunit B
MAKIVLATFGSLGDLHPKIALGLELKRRGHGVTIAAMDFYRAKIETIGLGFARMAPHLDPDDKEAVRDLMDAATGTENILRGVIMPSLWEMYRDLTVAVENADALLTGEIVYAAPSVVEKTGIKWISTSLAPISLFSAYDPPVPPPAPWFEHLRFLGPSFHQAFFRFMRWNVRGWYEQYKEFRNDIGLDPDHDPIFTDKFSGLLHLVMFSKILGKPQPDWPESSVQTGFCLYDGQNDFGQMPEGLNEFLDVGDPPVVFTLGSAAVMDAGTFYTESVKAANLIGRRAVLLYGIDNEPPPGSDDNIAAFEYAPYSRVFPRAACVVHSGGIGTTAQVLRAGIPHLIMPYGNDQPDNAARCRRLGVAEVIGRGEYTAKSAATRLRGLLGETSYKSCAAGAAAVVRTEYGTTAACDAIERVLRN